VRLVTGGSLSKGREADVSDDVRHDQALFCTLASNGEEPLPAKWSGGEGGNAPAGPRAPRSGQLWLAR